MTLNIVARSRGATFSRAQHGVAPMVIHVFELGVQQKAQSHMLFSETTTEFKLQ